MPVLAWAIVLAVGGCSQASRGEQVAEVSQRGPARVAQADLRVNNFVGIVQRVETREAVVRAEVIGGAPGLRATVSTDGPLTVEGPDTIRNSRCNTVPGGLRIEINGTRYTEADLPVLRISGPATMRVEANGLFAGGGFGDVGGSAFSVTGCQAVSVGRVSGDLDLDLAGSGDVDVGSVSGAGVVNLAGSGQVRLGRVDGDLRLNVAGSGDTRVAEAGGNLAVNVAGSGDVLIAAGRSKLDVNIAGSGDVRLDGTAVDPKVAIVGSGDVIVAAIVGSRSVSRMGTGSLQVTGSN
ncbi:MAG: DUF2807 domain-containing protein [Hyphomonadaceae bacterium]|nr:DUF2807 domain-containing protein [Hyphomonadaceae bacterium]